MSVITGGDAIGGIEVPVFMTDSSKALLKTISDPFLSRMYNLMGVACKANKGKASPGFLQNQK